MKNIKSFHISGIETLPIIEGGKGVGVTNGITAGHFAKSGAVGTFSGVNADYIDENGKFVPQ
ncbi:MAG: nitronate monooxygenase, partial [Pelagibacterales bacterium]|nr:nitronate monooxygenase [Pelagibacterales bacterium]